ncbi:hypothetical protein BD770DRAFT_146195 [Pilaira anomala]|nr:hypothetical protein BD770DRAFT_146195 [Pilaira anomala]
MELQKNKSILIYGVAVISLAILGTSLTYYVLEDDRRAKRRKEARKNEKSTLRTLQQIKEQVEKIESDMKEAESTVEDEGCTDKEFKRKEYTLAHTNELLLQLMEKLDAIRPLTAILKAEEEKEATEFENELVSNIKQKKRKVIESIESIFSRLDVANAKSKKESARREKIAVEKKRLEEERIRLELEEAERKAKEEEEKEKVRLEQEKKAKEEAERVAKEEAERRLREEAEVQKAKEIEQAELFEKERLKLLENDQVTAQEEAILAALKQVEHDEK